MYTHIWMVYIRKSQNFSLLLKFHCIFASGRIFVMDVASECASQKKQSLSSALSQNLKCILTVFNRPQLFARQFSFHLTSFLFVFYLILSSRLAPLFFGGLLFSDCKATEWKSAMIVFSLSYQSEKMRSIAFYQLAHSPAFELVFGCDHVSAPHLGFHLEDGEKVENGF